MFDRKQATLETADISPGTDSMSRITKTQNELERVPMSR